ncbi:hypothetical protein [Phreatobacter stygius]|uniref:Uncharacterized protein n=1 Tax=Phreatobacter stygius TaxID=1940610 RepID=A0A4D7BJ89_9HYPH|nr:hypothetical protein [Phreatobacter stygius]QCI67787.1 hypothetical protein E8M01_28320 [Phreatobacter stygius]
MNSQDLTQEVTVPIRRILAALLWTMLVAGPARAQWLVQDIAARPGSAAVLDLTYRSSGEKFTVVCSETGVFISYAAGFRVDRPRDRPIAGTYQIDDGPSKPISWTTPGRTAYVSARYAESLLRDIAGAARLFIQFAGVEQTFDLTPLLPYAESIRRRCRMP